MKQDNVEGAIVEGLLAAFSNGDRERIKHLGARLVRYWSSAHPNEVDSGILMQSGGSR